MGFPREKPQGSSVGTMPDVRLSKDAKGQERLDATALLSIVSAIQGILRKLNGLLSFGTGANGSWSGNFDGQFVEWTFTASATEATIPHGLGRTPRGYWVCRRSANCIIYDSNVGGWGPAQFYLKSDLAATVLLLVF